MNAPGIDTELQQRHNALLKATQPNLKAAFQQLRKQGLFARMNFKCCQSCGCAAIPKDKEAYCFFHLQDNDNRVAGKPFYLAFGWNHDEAEYGDERTDDKVRAIGWQIMAALAANNVGAEWDGSPNTRIRVVRY